MDMSTISAAYNGLKTAKDIFTGFAEMKTETDSLSRINDAVKKVGDAQDALFQLREELFKLQEENNNLKKAILDFESWEKKISEYELVKTSGNAIVYQYNGAPEHFICPSCASKRIIEILQDNRTATGKFRCIGCKGEYPIKQKEFLSPVKASNYPYS